MAATDVYIEASGAPAVLPQIIRRAKSGARVVVVALHREDIPVNFLLVMMKQLELLGSIAQPDDWQDMIEMLGEVAQPKMRARDGCKAACRVCQAVAPS